MELLLPICVLTFMLFGRTTPMTALRNDHVGHRPDLSRTIDQVRWSGLCLSGDKTLDNTKQTKTRKTNVVTFVTPA